MTLWAACGSEVAPPPAATAGQSGAPATENGLYGSFTVTLVPPIEETSSPATTTIFGKLADGPSPAFEVWAATKQAAGCTLYEPKRVFCEPTCGSSAACVTDGKCQPYPKPQTAGTIMLSGIGESPIAMDPIADNYQPKAGTRLPFPPCKEGDALTLTAANLELAGRCIAPLEFSGKFPLRKGEPLRLTWGAPAQTSLAKIGVKLDISHHGGSKGKLECEVADTGSLEIPVALVDGLLELGFAGFPTVTLTRRHAAAGSGVMQHVSLIVAAPVERPIEIPGLTSCSEDTDCPSGQTCKVDRACG